MRQRGTDARHFVGGNADTNAGATDQNGAVVFALQDFIRHPVGQVGIEGIRPGFGARNLGHLMRGFQMVGEDFGKAFARAVARDCKFHRFLLHKVAATRARMSR